VRAENSVNGRHYAKIYPATSFSEDVIQLIVGAPETGSYSRCDG